MKTIESIPHAERTFEDLRSNVDKLYSARSSYVHTGQISDPKEQREMALDLAKNAIAKDILDYH